MKSIVTGNIYFNFLVAVMGQTNQHTKADIAVPIVTIANISSIYVGSKSEGITEPSLTSTGKITIKNNPHPNEKKNLIVFVPVEFILFLLTSSNGSFIIMCLNKRNYKCTTC